MLQFTTIQSEHAPLLRRYYARCPYQLCEYSLGVKLFWQPLFHTRFAEVAGCLLTESRMDGRIVYDFPVAGPEGDIDAALLALETYCMEEERFPVFVEVPKEELPRLVKRYPFCRVKNNRLWQDYLYLKEDLRDFAGRRYAGQRNHIHKFQSLYPDYHFRPLTQEDDLSEFWRSFEEKFHKSDPTAIQELKLAKDLVRFSFTCPWFYNGCIEVGGRIVALSVGETCGNTMQVHVEKALAEYEGVYPLMVTEFVRYYGTEDIGYVNREDDNGDRGLRISKTQYHPHHMGEKFTVIAESNLADLDAVPSLSTERLTLRGLLDTDRDAYNALCLDEERNRYWGWDYREHLGTVPSEDAFLRMAREDFDHHMCVNFAVCLDNELIGEVIVYHSDYKGAFEIGFRIDRAHAGQHYGQEALERVIRWVLYELGCFRVVAKCQKENTVSERILSSIMSKTGEDDTYFHFEKTI